MATPSDIDPEARQLFDEAGWRWQGSTMKYIETWDSDRESTSEYNSRPKRSISYEDLRDHDLIGNGPRLNRLKGLEWLRTVLGRNK
jgi:hypothetical protein